MHGVPTIYFRLMKKILLYILALAMALPVTAQSYDVRREHRAIWMSPYLSATWPQGQITEANAETKRNNIRKNIQRMRGQGINVIYYHVRAMCDANYASSYEPYSSQVAGTRGGTPAFDPFEVVVQTAHEEGLEVYAWVNPYRYSSGGTYGAGERNYENSHPDWLIKQSDRIILNPGIPEVQDRIEAVVSEIATNYDIDGMIFDDYFYNSTPTSLDAEQYNAYKAGGGVLDQAAWRRGNVDETVRRSYQAVKAARPYAVFAIGPAGRISPPNVADYGLEAGPYGDMNYNELHADPIKWLHEGWLDFLSPQVYWVEYFYKLTDWYTAAARKLGRHVYSSLDASRLPKHKAEEYLNQIDYLRNSMRRDQNGVVWFDYGAFNNYFERIDNVRTIWGDILAAEKFQNDVLQPLQPWRGDYKPAVASNVHREGSKLSWNEPEGAENHRYTVYAVPTAEADASFAGKREYLSAVVYSNSFEIPEGEGVKYAVAVYSRYGYEYAPLFEGETAGTSAAPMPVAPVAGASLPELGALEWTCDDGRYLVEISDDASFQNILNCLETVEKSAIVSDIIDAEVGKTYYWRVRVIRANGSEALSDVASFTGSAIAITSPTNGEAEVALCPTIEWLGGGEGTEYTLELSSQRSFAAIDHTATVNEARYVVPECVLKSGSTYYVRVKAVRNGKTATSAISQFNTVNRSDYSAPAIVSPATDGATVHSNECIEVEKWVGMANVTLEISATTDFPNRGIYSTVLKDFETSSRELGDIKISGKALVDGTTYYARTRGTYALTTEKASQRTEYSAVRSFVYSASAGIAEVAADSRVYIEGTTLHFPADTQRIELYDLTGRHIATHRPQGCTLDLGEGTWVISKNCKDAIYCVRIRMATR